MHSPRGAENPDPRIGICGFTRIATSRIQRLNLAITNPRLITAMLVRTQARKVRSLARISDSILSGSSCPFLCPELLSVLLDSDILSQFGFAAGRDVAQSVSETA